MLRSLITEHEKLLFRKLACANLLKKKKKKDHSNDCTSLDILFVPMFPGNIAVQDPLHFEQSDADQNTEKRGTHRR